jgi:hypothetical protein
MDLKEKAGRSLPIPKHILAQDCAESNSSTDFAQALARSVFGRSYIVERKPLAENFRKRAPSRIRAWRAPA